LQSSFHDRSAGELRGAAGQNGALVAEHFGHITGYTTGVAFLATRYGDEPRPDGADRGGA
jgi:hypothetical protein